MKIADIKAGQVVKFTVKVENSSQGQAIQEVLLRVSEVTTTLIKGVNVNRILDGTQEALPYRSFKISNIVGGTAWLKLDD